MISVKSLRHYASDRRVQLGLWLVVAIAAALTRMKSHNNFDIFRYVFYHTWEQAPLYLPATDGSYGDMNHYGPLFSLIIAPFAVCPVWLGLLMWDVLLAVFLFWAFERFSTLSRPPIQTFLIWFCAHEMLLALFYQQFNVATVGMILVSYVFVEKEREGHAAFFIVLGTLIKLYGIVGLAFFFFSRHKLRFVLYLLGWTAVLVCLPMLISSPDYILQQYQAWYVSLCDKNDSNLLNIMQNVSVLGIVRKVQYVASGGYVVVDHLEGGKDLPYSDLWILVPAMLYMAAGYFRISQWKSPAFRQTILAAVLMFVCLFSTGSESCSYIIALPGCVIWYLAAPWKRSRWDVALMVFVLVVTSFSPSDLFPKAVYRACIQPFGMKALPVALVWLKLGWELLTRNYTPVTPQKNTI